MVVSNEELSKKLITELYQMFSNSYHSVAWPKNYIASLTQINHFWSRKNSKILTFAPDPSILRLLIVCVQSNFIFCRTVFVNSSISSADRIRYVNTFTVHPSTGSISSSCRMKFQRFHRNMLSSNSGKHYSETSRSLVAVSRWKPVIRAVSGNMILFQGAGNTELTSTSEHLRFGFRETEMGFSQSFHLNSQFFSKEK